ncbi:pentapeptide repeat-containing protein [Amycolatopsis sp. CB00013]|uniref:pentapeptide repeat-containing protein n=1 Tax=Amycolatopsis sp. CB00013 TaxID=1703945 RepID=UPI000AE01C52|nr:pentapeptide repeat-containing protein [Amycolatopsis sp. CB00013]
MATLLVGAGITTWLLLSHGQGGEQERNRLEAIKTAGTIVVGTGGAAALLLAARRQRTSEIALRQKDRDQEDVARTHRLQEQVALATQDDAAQRRNSELYIKSVEQIGSSQAVVRLGGLYALERLATENENHRQTAVNVFCAYLRMPFTPPSRTSGAGTSPDDPAEESSQQELQARLTAQRILVKHLRPTSPVSPGTPSVHHWKDVELDLADAALVNWDMRQCVAHESTFDRARFYGDTRFDGANLAGSTSFEDAHFHGPVIFDGAAFSNVTSFERTVFDDQAKFVGAWFGSTTSFDNTSFAMSSSFQDARFVDDAWFCETEFYGSTTYEDAYFERIAAFNDATFGNVAAFERASFNQIAGFGDVRFIGHAKFTGARFGHHAWFRRAEFCRTVSFDIARFSLDLWLAGATFHDDAWFRNLYLGGEASFEHASFSRTANFDSVRLGRPEGNRTVWP